MFIVNAGPGFKKMLWPAAQKFLDAKTIAKIQVVEEIMVFFFVLSRTAIDWISVFSTFVGARSQIFG